MLGTWDSEAGEASEKVEGRERKFCRTCHITKSARTFRVTPAADLELDLMADLDLMPLRDIVNRMM